MMTLVFFMTNSAFWWVFVFSVVLLVLSAIVSLDDDGGKGAFATFVFWMSLIGFLLLCASHFDESLSSTERWRSELIAEISPNNYIEERAYHEVEFLGKRPTFPNLSDGRRYVDLGNGVMISYNRIMNEGMCRVCEQFNTWEVKDSVYVYRVQKGAPRWWRSGPVMIFSKHPDIFLQSYQRVEVTSKTTEQ